MMCGWNSDQAVDDSVDHGDTLMFSARSKSIPFQVCNQFGWADFFVYKGLSVDYSCSFSVDTF